jgi:hypothetical protein
VGRAGHPWSEWDGALREGGAVIVSDLALFSALYRAGLDWSPYAYGGEFYGKRFLLDENDRLSEWAGDDEVILVPCGFAAVDASAATRRRDARRRSSTETTSFPHL